MKAKVIARLNKRLWPSTSNTPLPNPHIPDDIIEVVGEVEGQAPGTSTNNKWFKTSKQYYVWSGGVTRIPEEHPAYDPQRMSWAHRLYEIPIIWKDQNVRGNGVTVAVIDTGIDTKHVDLKDRIHKDSRSFLTDMPELDDIDGHGTEMAGIIAAEGHNVFGIAPEVKLLVLRVADYHRGVSSILAAEAFDYASTLSEVDVISCSNTLLDDPQLAKAVAGCIQKGKVVLAAIGNHGEQNPTKDFYPACYPDVVAVGAFDQQGTVCSFSNWNNHLSFVCPGDNALVTTGLNNQRTMGSGTSAATAVAAGCMALMVALAKRKRKSIADCINACIDTCDDAGETVGRDIQSGSGRLNLRNAINKL